MKKDPQAKEQPSSTEQVTAPQREPRRCIFGAIRVGALLGRLRLHVQTERFLAAHREDWVWEAGCVKAALALADVVCSMTEDELDHLLPPQGTPSPSAQRANARTALASAALAASAERTADRATSSRRAREPHGSVCIGASAAASSAVSPSDGSVQ